MVALTGNGALPRSGRLAGKVAIITGAGTGIGRASAERFAAEGAAVACVGRRREPLDEVVAAIRAAGGTAIAVPADVTSGADAERMVATTVAELGGLDILFNNAGTGVWGRLHELAEKDWDHVIETNLKSIFHCSRPALVHFLQQGSGNIINTASTFGLLAPANYPSYTASKGAVVMLTRQMAIDYGPAIRVNCICPGATDTPRIRRFIQQAADPAAFEAQLGSINRVAQRLARSEEVAAAALFLASEDASFVMGHALVVDGGQTIDA